MIHLFILRCRTVKGKKKKLVSGWVAMAIAASCVVILPHGHWGSERSVYVDFIQVTKHTLPQPVPPSFPFPFFNFYLYFLRLHRSPIHDFFPSICSLILFPFSLMFPFFSSSSPFLPFFLHLFFLTVPFTFLSVVSILSLPFFSIYTLLSSLFFLSLLSFSFITTFLPFPFLLSILTLFLLSSSSFSYFLRFSPFFPGFCFSFPVLLFFPSYFLLLLPLSVLSFFFLL